ncbi:AFR167Wp [Eremothecium gossypii ATCC 10895]|uniref:AFR167Wp n=1 Tax=Eremothecium gossypii (strain ATCC 10895 / CBS 109.51 / FGSC 9923 / NRRL Y-1056) TaxID=284811 RepID=Q754A5_EREGS|nr:AFR167Wp [Eremothecium gossypii ATCC 10895]AAS53538.1 AFR167Wp [Eremothecium gossypii ATCC 10895]AEY97851.1 FAFR167Wp [Eremothecium gossypii FDAG1]
MSDEIEADGSVRGAPRDTGRGTLDESAAATLVRDVRAMHARLRQAVYPALRSGWQPVADGPPETDLWAPLVFVLAQAALLARGGGHFYALFVVHWGVLALLAAHLKLMRVGEKRSWLVYVSACGYCLFPLVMASLLSRLGYPTLLLFFAAGPWRVRALYCLRLGGFLLSSLWAHASACAVASCVGFIECYPLALCLAGLSWLSVVV